MQMQCRDEHAVKSPTLQCARTVPLCPGNLYLVGLRNCAGRIADALTMASTPVMLTGRAHQGLLVQTRGEPTVIGTVACCARDFGAKLNIENI